MPTRKTGRATRKPVLPVFRPFQLCTAAETVPAGDDWLFELKLDGYRAQAAVAGPAVRIYTRNGHDWTEQFRVLVASLRSLTGGSSLIDGEIVAVDAEGRTSFSKLKTGIAAGSPLKFYAFDLLELNGQDLSDAPLLERKRLLEDLLGDRDPQDPVQLSHYVVGNGQAMLDAVTAGGHEGVIAKQTGAKYSGDRTSSWLKIKVVKRQEFVVGGWRPKDTGSGMASLIIGTYQHGKLLYRGRVGTGFTEAARSEIFEQLKTLQVSKPAFASVPRDIARQARWVRPELIAEIAYAEITPDGSLRHPSFQGMRADKRAEEVVLESPVSAKPDVQLDPVVGTEAARALGVTLTHPDKVLYPGTGITKGHLAAYYAAVAGRMLPFVADRPLTLVRDTDGTLHKTFFQKHQLPGMSKALKAGELPEMGGSDNRILWVDDLAGLLGGVQMNVLEFHIWGSQRGEPMLPERVVFDIDPDEGLGFEHVKRAATDIRDVLGAMGLRSWPLVSGGKGVHVVVPLVPLADWDETKAFCKNFVDILAKAEPDRFVSNMSKAKRKGRMFLDYLRNGQGATAICPWSTRARAGATVAVPVTWDELGTLDRANSFTIFDAASRAQAPADAWAGYFEVEQVLSEAVRNAVRGLAG